MKRLALLEVVWFASGVIGESLLLSIKYQELQTDGLPFNTIIKGLNQSRAIFTFSSQTKYGSVGKSKQD